MFVMGRKALGQVWSMFDKSSASTRNSRDCLVLGKIEETDHLGVALHKEATYGHRRALKKVLNTAICVDYPNDLGQTPLFCACARGNESTAVLLLQWRANPNEKSLDGMTPCHAAAYIGNVYLLGKLIEAGGDLRLHDNNQNNMRDWALKNPDLRKRSKMVYFIDKTQMHAIACSEQAVCPGTVMAPSPRSHKQTSVMSIMKRKTGNDFSFESLRQAQSTGFGKVYLGNNYNGGIISAVPLISEAALQATGEKKCDTGSHSCLERMQWFNEAVSVKQLKPDVGFEDSVDLLLTDAEFLGKLRHPNILLLMGICQSTNLDRIMLIFEFVENLTLHHFLHQTTNSLSFHDHLCIMQQICAAMDFIHSQHLIHCGLSSMAVYLVSSQAAKVGNFEFMVESIRTDLGKPSPVSLVSHGESLYNWMSPELLQGLAPHYSSDVYSFCCIVWELFTREVPWQNVRPENIRKKVVEDKKGININIPKIPENIKTIIGYGLELVEERRLNKFSFIIDGLKCDQVPNFQRTSTPHYLQNKSDNFPDSLSYSSTSSTSSMKNKANTWDQDRLDFSRLNDRIEDSCTSDSLSVSGEEIDNDNFTLPLCNNYLSSHGQASVQIPHNNVLTSVSAHSDTCKKPQENRKCVSDSDIQHQTSTFLHTNPIKPASHLHGFNPGSQPLPGSDPYQFHPLQSNSEASATTQHRHYASQSKSGTSYDKPKSAKSVKKMVDWYQSYLSQQKLRQAILKGSMAPGGLCKDLESSSESTRRSSDSQAGDENYDICEDAKHVSTEKSVVDVDMSSASAVEANKYSHVKSSTPQKSVGPDRKTSQQLALENRDPDCHKELPRRLEKDEIYGCAHTHKVILQEVREVQRKLMSRSVGAGSKLPSRIDHQSPHIETCCPAAKLSNHLSKLADTSSSQNEALVLPTTSKLQSDESLHRKVRIQSVCQTSNEMGKENNSVCDVNSHTDTYDNTDHQLEAQILDLSCEMDECLPILKAQESRLSFKERYSLIGSVDVMKKCSIGIKHKAGQLGTNKHLLKTSETAKAQEVGESLLKENKQKAVIPAGADDADTSFHLEAAVTRTYKMASGVCNHDDSASCTQKTSVDSEKIDHWIDSTLAKIKEKAKLRPCLLNEETESGDSLHGLTDISTASTLEEDGDKEESSCLFHTAVSKVGDEFKVYKSCDFEFREFYIDDDLDSTQYIQQDKSCFQAPYCMTRHSADDTAMVTVAAGNVKKKAEFFSRMMTNVNPSVFPGKPKKSPEPSEKNVPCADLSVDNIETEKKNAVSSRNIRDGHTFESDIARPCVLAWRKQTIKRKGDFKDSANQETVPKSSTPLDQVDKACQVISMDQLYDRGNKVSEACCITQACQTSFTGMYQATAGSDSDSDLWVKSRLITIQDKIHRRRSRLAYSVSSDESSGDEEFSVSQQQSTDSRRVMSHERTSTEADAFTGCPDKENKCFVNSKTCKDHSQKNGLAVKKAGIAEQKIKELQHFTIPKPLEWHFTTNRDSHNERQRKESLSLSESFLKKKKLKSKRHGLSPKLVNSTARQQCDDLISTNCDENKAEVNASKRSSPEMPILQDSVVRTVLNSHKKKNSSKNSDKGSDDCVDNSRVNTVCKGSANLCEVLAKESKPPKKTRNSASSHGCETSVDDSISKKSHHSILRRPRNLSTNLADLSITGTNSLIPPPVPLSRSKFSLGRDSKVSDRVISFQDISDSEPEIPDSKKEQVPLKPSRLSRERSLQRNESLDSSKCDEFVKTWLEREDFAERVSLDSSRQIVPQSITSKVMEMQSMSSKEASVPHKISEPALSLQSGNALLKTNSASMTSKQSAAHMHETDSRKQSASKDAKECMNLNLMDSTFIMPDSAAEEQDVELTSDSNQVRLLGSQSKPDRGSQKSSVTRDRHNKNTLPRNINNDCCLTLDLSSFSNENITECSSFKGSEKPSPLGVHRFYIPHERCCNGCTAQLKVSFDATDPAVHRITSTTTDLVSGLTETLLDHTICTHKLKSTIKLE